MSLDSFWHNVDRCLSTLRSSRTVDDVINTLNGHFAPSSGDAFFGGSGGDTQIYDVLSESPHWIIMWSEDSYYFTASDANGDTLTYVEGDVYRGDHSPSAAADSTAGKG